MYAVLINKYKISFVQTESMSVTWTKKLKKIVILVTIGLELDFKSIMDFADITFLTA
jgi:hypothetical protein